MAKASFFAGYHFKFYIMKTKEIEIPRQTNKGELTPYELAVEQQRNQKIDAEWVEDFLDAHGWGDYTD